MFRCRFLIGIALLFSVVLLGTSQTKTDPISITEPARYRLSDLYSHADKVALVKVLSGTTEAYEDAVYKGQVVKAFKGTSEGDIIYFGPYSGTQLGSEYVLFLKDVQSPLLPKDKAAGYGVVRYSKVFDEGYSSMLSSYECVFQGTNPGQQCDYAVRVCTDYIVLPKSLPTAPPTDKSTPFGCRWAKRDRFSSALDEMAKMKP
jgi:hypothetical protein